MPVSCPPLVEKVRDVPLARCIHPAIGSIAEPRSEPGELASAPILSDPSTTRYSDRYTQRVASGEWQVYVVNEARDWIDSLDDATHTRVVQAIDTLADVGPGLGRPLVDTIHGSSIANLKELRPGTVRILFAFDPWRDSILLVAGDKAPLAEQRYERYLKERLDEEEQQR
jgi:hypothetical protein